MVLYKEIFFFLFQIVCIEKEKNKENLYVDVCISVGDMCEIYNVYTCKGVIILNPQNRMTDGWANI